MSATGHRVAFACDGRDVEVECAPGESLLSVLRERLGIRTVKDGCAPQGQCGCCTVLVGGEPRVACVTAVERVAGKDVTTLAGLDPGTCDRLAHAFLATGGSQCGFCTPGILVRTAALAGRGRTSRPDVDRALAAHLCRCTGWQTVYEAIELAVGTGTVDPDPASRSRDAATQRSTIEGGTPQTVHPSTPLGEAGFSDDTAPRDALVAVPLPPGVEPESTGAIEAAGGWWVVGDTLPEARARAGKVQGRRTTVTEGTPIAWPDVDAGVEPGGVSSGVPGAAADGTPDAEPGGNGARAVRLATGWVEPAYLEPDASWCEPGGEPVSPLANGGAFGGKRASLAPIAARELADRFGRTVRVVYAREDCVRLGPKRPPIAAVAWYDADGEVLHIRGRVANGAWRAAQTWPSAYRLAIDARWDGAPVLGPPIGDARAMGLAEQTALVEGALDAAGVDRGALVVTARAAAVLLDVLAPAPTGDALAGARVHVDPASGAVTRVEVRVAAGDPLDAVVLRSYCIGAAHMALGWVCTEGLAVDPVTGEVLDLTIRSFGIVRPARTPPIDVTIVDDPGPAQPAASDAVFAAVAAATWNALARAEGSRPEVWPAATTRAARLLRRA